MRTSFTASFHQYHLLNSRDLHFPMSLHLEFVSQIQHEGWQDYRNLIELETKVACILQLHDSQENTILSHHCQPKLFIQDCSCMDRATCIQTMLRIFYVTMTTFHITLLRITYGMVIPFHITTSTKIPIWLDITQTLARWIA